jgi:hypothetical protein
MVIDQRVRNLRRLVKWEKRRRGIVEPSKISSGVGVDDLAIVIAAIAIVLLW